MSGRLHYRSSWRSVYPACGSGSVLWGPPPTTSDPALVTCGACVRTHAFRAAASAAQDDPMDVKAPRPSGE